jgi:Fe-S oxidoreductase
MWRHTYRDWAGKLGIAYDVEARHYTELIGERLADGRFAFPPTRGPVGRVAWHDPCHLGRASGLYGPPRAVIEALPGAELAELAHHHDDALCCGGVVTLLHDPQIACKLARDVLAEARATGAATLVSACPCCQLLFRLAGDGGIRIVDLSHLAAEALGHKLSDPTPDVRRLWAGLSGEDTRRGSS